jgi:glyoxylate reductase
VGQVFVTRALPGDALGRLEAAGHVVEVHPGDLPPTRAQLRAGVANADGLLSMLTERIDQDVLDHAPRLRVVANYAVGSDNIDHDAAEGAGIAVTTTPDVLTDATADLTLALLLAAARRLPEAAQAVRDGAWRTWEPRGWLGLELRGARLAVVGPGRIGRAVAERAAAFGMDVVLVGRGEAVPADADVVSLHTPLTAETRRLVDPRALKPGAILVNTSRGGLVDAEALADALHSGHLAAAALDVTDPEPLPADHPLLSAPNLLVTPHIGSATYRARERMAELAVDGLLTHLP